MESDCAETVSPQTAKEFWRDGPFRALCETSSLGIIVGRKHEILYANGACCDMFGYEAEEWSGKPFAEMLTPDVLPQAEKITPRPLRGARKKQTREGLGHRKDGSQFPISVEVNALPLPEGEATIVFTRDITERKLHEEALRRSLENLSKTLERTIHLMALTVELKDPYTAGHQRRVARLAVAISQEMGLPQDQVDAVRTAAALHDIGKINVPAEILSKPGVLATVEFDLIKAHCETGYCVLKAIDFPWPIADMVLQHHEKLDGSGYPRGLKGDEILLGSKILRVADTAEAMASHRPYRPALGIGKALNEISSHSGSSYDKQAARACLRLFKQKGFRLDSDN